jgi:hypothetical protein
VRTTEVADDPLLDPIEAGKYLGGVSPGTLAVWRSLDRYKIPFIKVGAKVRYRQSDLDAFLKERQRVRNGTSFKGGCLERLSAD